jgi:hypothetical protein
MPIHKLRHGLIIVTGCVLLTAACSGDRSPLAPTTRSQSGPVAADQVSSGTTTRVGDTLITVFLVNNADTTNVRLFDMADLTFTPNAICDLSSSYGPSEWDQPCEPNAASVTVTAKGWLDANGHPRVDFQPHMRFNPAADPIFITLKDGKKAQSALSILYCADGVAQCYDEATLDPSLATFRTGKKYSRRIKHFSGYNIASGYAE